MRKRRRRPVVNWLPVPGVQVVDSENGFENRINGFTFALGVDPTGPGAATGGIITAFTSLTFDQPGEQRLQKLALGPSATFPSLRDFVQGSAYRLRRIVGKVNIGYTSQGDGQTTSPPSCVVGVGFIVLKVDPDDGNPLDNTNPQEYSPLSAKNIDDPWIWRRTWLLGKNTLGSGDGSFTDEIFRNFAENTSDYGSIADGPHIDQKTARLIQSDERLFFVVSTKAVPLTTVYQTGGLVAGYLDYRLLGSIVSRASSNRRNASR